MSSLRLFDWSWWTASIGRRMGLIMCLIVLLTGAVIYVSLRGMAALNGQLDATVVQHVKATALVTQMLEETRRLSDSAHSAAAAMTPEERTQSLAKLDDAKKTLGERIDQISAQLGNAPELQSALQEGYSSFVISAVKASRLVQAGRQQDAERELLVSFDPKLLNYVLMTISGVSQHTERAVEIVADSGRATYASTQTWLISILVAVAVSITMALWLLHNVVVKPVRRVAYAAGQLAHGRFDMDLHSTSHDECGELLKAMAVLRQRLADIIGTIRSASHTVTVTSDGLAQNNRDLSASADAQVRAFQEASAALDSVNEMAKHGADNAQRLSRDIQAAFGAAQKGNAIIAEVISTMQATSRASTKIGNTVNMIDEIAFKTNILALNAAVEAARAGEHGNTFAVVAGEVRELAAKSAGAAKEIEKLIVDSAETVSAGSSLAANAGVAIAEIVRQVQAVADYVAELANTSREQSRRAEEVSRAMGEIDASTRNNADMVSDAAVSAEALRNEARALGACVAGFGQEELLNDVITQHNSASTGPAEAQAKERRHAA